MKATRLWEMSRSDLPRMFRFAAAILVEMIRAPLATFARCRRGLGIVHPADSQSSWPSQVPSCLGRAAPAMVCLLAGALAATSGRAQTFEMSIPVGPPLEGYTGIISPSVSALDVDTEGNIYVSDANRIQKFSFGPQPRPDDR